MAGSVLEEFFIQIGVNADDVRAGEKAVTAAVLGMQKQLQGLVDSFNKSSDQARASQKKLGQSTEKVTKDLEASAKKTSDYFGGLKRELLAFAGITLSIGGAVGFVKQMTAGVMQLSIQSKALDMSAKKLDGYKKAAEEAGSSGAAMLAQLNSVQSAINDAGAGNFDNIFAQVAVPIASRFGERIDLRHQDADTVERKLLMALSRMPERLRNSYGKQFGYDQAMLQNIQGFLSSQRKYERTSTYSEDEERKARELNSALVKLNSQFDSMKNTLYVALIPYAEQLIGLLNQWGAWIQSHPKEVQEALDNIQTAIKTLAGWASDAAKSVGGWSNAIEYLVGAAVGLKLLGLLNGVGASIMGPAGLIAALVALEQVVIKPMEDKYPWLKNNAAANSLNSLPGSDAVSDAGKRFHDWVEEKLGINLPRGDEYGQGEPRQRAQAARGIRNNNPGNINYVGQDGASLESPGGRFAKFNSAFDGLKAMANQLFRYFTGKTTGSSLDTISKIISTWAPGSENNTGAYIKSISKKLGIGADEKLNLNDPAMMAQLMAAMTQHENGYNPYSMQITTGAAAAVLRRNGSVTNNNGGNVTSETNFGQVNVYSNPTSVSELVRDVNQQTASRRLALANNSSLY